MINSTKDLALKILIDNRFDLKKSKRLVIIEYLKYQGDSANANYWVDVGQELEIIYKTRTKIN